WGISGPRFLLLYVVLPAGTVLVAVVAGRRALAEPGEGAAGWPPASAAAALVGGGPVPGGFDPERVRATVAALGPQRRTPRGRPGRGHGGRGPPLGPPGPPGRRPGRAAAPPGRDRPRPRPGERWLSVPLGQGPR
ncbi:MAG TPA: hypothetical protein VF468_31045, partial [Actinomycetota bacterium]|nr:hypothetical protein [Actinomycetota bacterium]